MAETEHEPVVAYVARCKVENDQMCCLYFVYFCVFLYLVPGSVSLLVFYVFLCFPGFFVLSSWVYLSPRPWYRVALGCSSLLFVMCFMCFRVFLLFLFQCHCSCFVCFCVFVYISSIAVFTLLVPPSLCFLCFYSFFFFLTFDPCNSG